MKDDIKQQAYSLEEIVNAKVVLEQVIETVSPYYAEQVAVLTIYGNITPDQSPSGFVLMSGDDFNKLKTDSEFLNCLRNAGVDNWPGYEEAQNEMEESNE